MTTPQRIEQLRQEYRNMLEYLGADVEDEMNNFDSKLNALLLAVQDEQKEKLDIKQNIYNLRAMANICQSLGEIMKVKDLEIAEDIWQIEDTLNAIAYKLEHAPYAYNPTKETA